MATALGLIGVLAFIAGTVGIAAAVTWLVVRISPTPGAKSKSEKAA